MDLKHRFQIAGLARVSLTLAALATISLLSIAPAALAQGNDAWANSSNGYGWYHEGNG
jgi:hypothetical protein